MNISNAKDLYDNVKTYANVKSALKRVNELMGYEPALDLHYEKYVQHFELICGKILSSGLSKTKTDLLQKFNFIVGIASRLKIDPTDLRQKVMELKLDTTQTIPDAQPQNDARPWSEMLQVLQHEIDTNKNKFAKIMCICFKHGYVLRCGEIFKTTTGFNIPTTKLNFLDLNSRQWTITEHKSQGSAGVGGRSIPARTFPVTKEFVDELRPYIYVPEFLLIYKSNRSAYSTHLLHSVDIDSFSNNELRNSYEEWNWRNSGRTLAQKRFWSENIIGHSEIIAKLYYTTHMIESNILTAADPSSKFFADATGKISSSGKFKLKIMPKVKSS